MRAPRRILSASWGSWSKLKEHLFSKNLILIIALSFLSLSRPLAEGDIVLNVHGYLGSVFSSNYNAFPVKSEYGGGVKLAYRTPTILELSAGFDYLMLPRETTTSETLSSATVMRANVGVGFYIPLAERFALLPSVNAGVYNLSVSGESKTSIFFGGGLSFIYKINPHLSFEAPLMVAFNRGVFADVGIAPGISINLTKMFRRDTLISMNVKEMKPIFPVLYSWYEKNPFATISITNEEEAGITDVSVNFFQGQYMTQPQLCATKKRVEKQESFDVNLVAFFNEQMLELIEKVDTLGSVIVEYRVLGQKKRKTFPITLGIYGRNSMSWDDDRRAAVFVSSKDPAAMLFSRHVTSSVRNNLRSGVPLNIQYAMGIFEALDEFGINYVIDPNSSYSDNVGSTSIDFLQFPYQTLMYRGGDCDDLSILTCSLFESVGVHTAFITIPGHIFIAFDSGVKQKDAWRYFNSLDEYIISDGEIWVPLEITLSDEGYTKAWRVGAREWHVAARTNEAMLYKMRDSWDLYKPVGVSGAKAKFTLPEKKQLLSRFSDSVDHWITREIDPQIRSFKTMLAKKEDPGIRNDFGILYVRYGLFDEAEKQFRIARKYNNKNALLNTASMYFAKEQYENAAYMYRQVINNDPKSILAYLGLARCAFEMGDYETCDESYAMVRENDMDLAMEYAYLGSFETVRGRAFSLSERLEKTIWVGSNAFMNGQYEILDKSMYEEPKIGLSNPYIHSTQMEYKIPEIEKTIVKKYEQSDDDSFTGSMYDSVAGKNSNGNGSGTEEILEEEIAEAAERKKSALKKKIQDAAKDVSSEIADAIDEEIAAENIEEIAGEDGGAPEAIAESPKAESKIAGKVPEKQAARAKSAEQHTVTESIAETTSAVVESVSKTAGQVAEAVSKKTEEVVESISKTTEAVVESVSKTTEAVVETVSKTTEAVVEYVSPIVDSIYEKIDPVGAAKKAEERKEAAAKKEEEKRIAEEKAEQQIEENAKKSAEMRIEEEIRRAAGYTVAVSEEPVKQPETFKQPEAVKTETVTKSEPVKNETVGTVKAEEEPKAVEVTKTLEEPKSIEVTEPVGKTKTAEVPETIEEPVKVTSSETVEETVEVSSSEEPVKKSSAAPAKKTQRRDIAIRISDGHTWERVAVNKAERKPEKGKKEHAVSARKRLTINDFRSFRQGKRNKNKLPYEAPRESRNMTLVTAVYEEDLKKKRFYIPLGRFQSFAGAYLFWLAHPDYPAVIVRIGYTEYEVLAGDYSEEEYEALKNMIKDL